MELESERSERLTLFISRQQIRWVEYLKTIFSDLSDLTDTVLISDGNRTRQDIILNTPIIVYNNKNTNLTVRKDFLLFFWKKKCISSKSVDNTPHIKSSLPLSVWPGTFLSASRRRPSGMEQLTLSLYYLYYKILHIW